MLEFCTNLRPTFRRAYVVKYWFRNRYFSKYQPKLSDFDIDIVIDIEMAQNAISFSVLVLKSNFPIIDIVIGFEINACQTELLVSNLNEQFGTALCLTSKIKHFSE